MTLPILRQPLFDHRVFANTVGDYVTALVFFVALLIVFKIIQVVVIHRLEKLAKKTSTDLDDTLIATIKSVKPPFYGFVAFYIPVQFLSLPILLGRIIDIILIIWIITQVIHTVQVVVNYFFTKKFKDETEGNTKMAIDMTNKIVTILLWIIGILLILSNLGINITSLIAGLGIGGIAIAFALQSILSDLFSSFAIYFDKPFTVGDYITVGENVSGTVKEIGIKTTRIKSLSGEEIIISNQELTTKHIQNFGRMTERRVVFTLDVAYGTSPEKLKKIPSIMENIIASAEQTRFARAHFKALTDSSLRFEVVYYVTTKSYDTYMDIQQNINLAIVQAFDDAKITMAFPTQTIHIAK